MSLKCLFPITMTSLFSLFNFSLFESVHNLTLFLPSSHCSISEWKFVLDLYLRFECHMHKYDKEDCTSLSNPHKVMCTQRKKQTPFHSIQKSLFLWTIPSQFYLYFKKTKNNNNKKKIILIPTCYCDTYIIRSTYLLMGVLYT